MEVRIALVDTPLEIIHTMRECRSGQNRPDMDFNDESPMSKVDIYSAYACLHVLLLVTTISKSSDVMDHTCILCS